MMNHSSAMLDQYRPSRTLEGHVLFSHQCPMGVSQRGWCSTLIAIYDPATATQKYEMATSEAEVSTSVPALAHRNQILRSQVASSIGPRSSPIACLKLACLAAL